MNEAVKKIRWSERWQLPDTQTQCEYWAHYVENSKDRHIQIGCEAKNYGTSSFESELDGLKDPNMIFSCYIRVAGALMQAFPSREFWATHAFLHQRHSKVAKEPSELIGIIWDERRDILRKAGYAPEGAMQKVYEILDSKRVL